jgi:hypothetical protein
MQYPSHAKEGEIVAFTPTIGAMHQEMHHFD